MLAIQSRSYEIGQLPFGLGLDVERLQPFAHAAFVAGDDELAHLGPQLGVVASAPRRPLGRGEQALRSRPRRRAAPRRAAAAALGFRLQHLAHLGGLDRGVDRRLAARAAAGGRHR